MKLLMERWQRFVIIEKAWMGKAFQTFKRRVAKGEHPLAAARRTLIGGIDEKTGQELEGSTRVVFQIPKNTDMVVKVIAVDLLKRTGQEWLPPDEPDYDRGNFNRHQKIMSNKNEASVKLQMKYQDIFPKIWEAAEDYSWILVERVELFATHKEMMEFLGLGEFSLSRQEWLVIMEEVFKQLQGRSRAAINARNDVSENADLDATVADNGSEREAFITRDEQMKVVEQLINNHHLRSIFTILAKTKFQPREFRYQNVGYSKITNKLILLDTGVWDEKL